jgi:hypothetical protein
VGFSPEFRNFRDRVHDEGLPVQLFEQRLGPSSRRYRSLGKSLDSITARRASLAGGAILRTSLSAADTESARRGARRSDFPMAISML